MISICERCKAGYTVHISVFDDTYEMEKLFKIESCNNLCPKCIIEGLEKLGLCGRCSLVDLSEVMQGERYRK